MEFECKIFPRLIATRVLNEIQQMMGDSLCESEKFTNMIFMSMFTGIVCGMHKEMMNGV